MISSPFYLTTLPLLPLSYGAVFQSFAPLTRSRRDISYIRQALLRDMVLTNFHHHTKLLISEYKRSSENGIKSQTVLKRHHENTAEMFGPSLSPKRRKVGPTCRVTTDTTLRPHYAQSYDLSKNQCDVSDKSEVDIDFAATKYYSAECDMRTLQEYSYLKHSARGDKWYSRCEELVDFKQENGHCNVPHGCKENKQLGAWVNTQRNKFKNGLLSKEYIECLKKLGFEWSPRNKFCQLWDQRYEDLVKYKKINGHCDIPKMYKENKKLAQWAVNQRYYFRNMNEEIQSSLFVERKERLIRIGFDSAYGNKINNK